MTAALFVPGIYDDCVVNKPGLHESIYNFKTGE